MQEIKLLYDGWPLINAPNSAAAIHLRSLLLLAPSNVQALLALPGNSTPDGIAEEIECLIIEEEDLGKWQQKQLPKILKSSSAQLIHSTLEGAALFGRHKTVISPTGVLTANLADKRLSSALGQGGMARAEILWPKDIALSAQYGKAHLLPPIAHPDFFGEAREINQKLDIPETFILYHGAAADKSIHNLLEAWTWAAASVGEFFPLLLLGLSAERRKWVEKQLPRYHLEDYVMILPEISWQDLIALYQNCSAVIANGEDEFWGGSARLALAAGKSTVGFINPAKEKLLGNAAYLVPEGDLRSFGAAMITVLVDEKVWEKFEDLAKKRAAKWDPTGFSKALSVFYEGLI